MIENVKRDLRKWIRFSDVMSEKDKKNLKEKCDVYQKEIWSYFDIDCKSK